MNLYKKLLFLLSLMFFANSLFAQNSISGQVLSEEDNLTLPGVNISVKDSTNGTTSDLDGNFKLDNVSPNDVLVFSYVGYDDLEIQVGTQSFIKAMLKQDSYNLDELVLVGYGTQTKKEVTGAVSVIGEEEITKLNATRIDQVLQGSATGVNVTSGSGSPGSGFNIRIRGISTNGDARPLILVDGNRIEDLSVINPNDIESMNVIKDATAGIYGVLAANGVILIKTKSGRKNMKPVLTVNSYYGIQETSKKIDVLNATEYAILTNESHANGGEAPPFTNYAGLGVGTDWQNEVFNTAEISDTNINFRGGTEKSGYSVGFSYLTQDGIVGGDKSHFDRITASLGYNYDFNEKLKLKSTLMYAKTNRQTLSENALGSVLFNALNMAPTMSIYDAKGNFTLAEGLGNEVINPIHQLANTYNDTDVNRISGTIGLSYEIVKNLTAQSNFQFNYTEVDGRYFSPTAFYGSGKVFNIDINSVYQNADIYKDYTWDNFLTYDAYFNDDHHLKALLGTSAFKITGFYSGLTGIGLPNNNFDNAYTKNAETVQNPFINGGNQFDSRLLSYFTRLQYDYKGKYLFSAVFRRDASTKFGPSNKVGYFPSASIGWVASEEDFLNDSETLSFLKFRASYGIIGNDRIGDYGFVSLLNGQGTYVFDDDLNFGKAIGGLSNPGLQWEEQKTLDIGLDAKFFNNSVDITFDYYKKRTENLLLSAQVAGILGSSAPGSSPPIINAGIIENKGIEFSIGYNGNFSEDSKFNISYNLTSIDNNVVYVNSDNGFIEGGSFGVGLAAPSRMEAGKPIGFFYGLQTDGIFQNQAEVDAYATQQNAGPGDLRYVDQNGDGIIDADDRVDLGNPIPEYTMGANIGFNIKGFDFSTSLYASLGNDIVRNYERNISLTNRRDEFINRWNGEGSSNDFPRMTTGTTSNLLLSDFYVEDGSYLRIQNIQIGYNLPDDILESLKMTKFRIYAAINNLYTFTKYKGFDPSASNGAPIGGGIDQGFYPVPTTYMMGVNLKF